ncbi:hypothetical protein [Emticicia sp. 17c]|uniref:hypothetical protein n=1 Tax=Emticicia sp. 17c TaxID=3127704 RepID=UPI00301DB939
MVLLEKKKKFKFYDMALGVKTKKSLEQGDIIEAQASILIYEKVSDSETKNYDTAILGDRIGYATGKTVKIGSQNYIEFVQINMVLTSQAPDFSRPKFYVLSTAPIAVKANPDYNYLSGYTTESNSGKFWGQLGNILSSVLTIFGGAKTTNTGPTANDSTYPTTTNNNTPAPEQQQTWLQKNGLLVGSVVVIIITGGIIFAVTKKKTP